MNVPKVFEQLGYTRKEANVYLAALSLGESTVSDIAEKVGLPRTSVQIIVDDLHKRGLMNFYVLKRYRYWVAEDPERLMHALHEKENALRTVMPDLKAMRRKSGGMPEVRVFVGADDIKQIHDDVIATKQNVLSFLPWDDWRAMFEQGYVEEFIRLRIEHFLRIKVLTPETERTKRLRLRDSSELRQTRFMPQNVEVKNAMFVYGTKVAIISLNQKRPTAVLIDSADINHMMTVFFEEMWERSR